MSTAPTEVKKILETAGIQDNASLRKYMEDNGFSRKAIRRAERGYRKYQNDTTRNFVFTGDDTFRVYDNRGQNITEDGRKLGNSEDRNFADVLGLGNDVSRFMGLVRDVQKGFSQRENAQAGGGAPEAVKMKGADTKLVPKGTGPKTKFAVSELAPNPYETKPPKTKTGGGTGTGKGTGGAETPEVQAKVDQMQKNSTGGYAQPSNNRSVSEFDDVILPNEQNYQNEAGVVTTVGKMGKKKQNKDVMSNGKVSSKASVWNPIDDFITPLLSGVFNGTTGSRGSGDRARRRNKK